MIVPTVAADARPQGDIDAFIPAPINRRHLPRQRV
jgi:hypothetical protein